MAKSASRSDGSNTAAPQGRREEILAIAAKVFAERGIASATVRDIGREAGILSGSLYHHFESKDEIICDLLRPVVERQTEHYREIVARELGPEETLRELVGAAVQEAHDRPYETLMIRNDAHLFGDMPALAVVEKARRVARSMWVTAVEEGIEAGAFRELIDPEMIVSTMFDAVLSSVRWFIKSRPAKPDDVAAMLAEFFVHGIVGR